MADSVAQRFLTACFCCAFLFTAMMPVSHCAAGPPGWVMDQKAYLYGECRSYISAKGLRVDFSTLGISVVANAPDWSVCVFRPSEKVEYRWTFKKFCGEGLSLNTMNRILPSDWKKLTPQKAPYRGLDCIRYTIEPYKREDVYGDVGYSKLHARRHTITGAELIAWEKGGMEKQAQIMSTLFGIPSPKGFPLSYKELYDDGKTGARLATKAVKVETLKPEWTALPVKYKLVAKDTVVTMSNSQREDMEESLLTF